MEKIQRFSDYAIRISKVIFDAKQVLNVDKMHFAIQNALAYWSGSFGTLLKHHPLVYL